MAESGQRFAVPNFEKLIHQKMPHMYQSVEQGNDYLLVEDEASNSSAGQGSKDNAQQEANQDANGVVANPQKEKISISSPPMALREEEIGMDFEFNIFLYNEAHFQNKSDQIKRNKFPTGELNLN